MLGCLDYPEGDRLALRYQMSDLSPKRCPPSLLNPAHRGRDQVSPARMARSFYDTGKKCGAMTVPASSLGSETPTPLRRDRAMQLNHRPARRDGTGPFYFAINGARSLASTARYRTARFVLRFSTAAEIVPLPSRSLRCRRISSSPVIASSVLNWPTVQASSARSRVAGRSLAL